MTLAPAAALQLGGKRYESHVHWLRVELAALPAVSSLRARLPLAAPVDALAGDDLVVSLDGGEGAETVLSGTLRAVRRTLREIELVGADASGDLAALRPNATYERQRADAVVQALCRDAGASCGEVTLDLALAAYSAGQGRSGAEHAAALAALAGATLVTSADGELLSASLATDRPTLALRHGRELLAYTVSDAGAALAEIVAVGAGPAGSADAPDALRPTPRELPEGATAAGAHALRRSTAVLRTPAAAGGASSALSAAAVAGATRMGARLWLNPALRPGLVIEVQDLPAGPSGGPWLLTRVVHELSGGTGQTTIVGIRAGAGVGPAGLLALAGSLL